MVIILIELIPLHINNLTMEVSIFLASSEELSEDRTKFKEAIYQLNDDWSRRDISFKIKSWESFIDSMSKDGLQSEYNKAVKESDIFLMLFFTKVGKYTEEEFETAFNQFTEGNKPRIYTFFKEDYILTGDIDDEINSLIKFKKKLLKLKHYTSTYTNIDNLIWQFSRQLEKLYGDPYGLHVKSDTYVINYVCKFISPNADETILSNSDFSELIKGLSDFGKNVVFQLAKVNRRLNRRVNPRLMARSIPIFQALADSKHNPQQEDHKYFGQLAFALKDREEMELEKVSESLKQAKALLDKAIELRDKYDIEYFYEFNRAICTIQLESNPDKELILKDLHYAMPGILNQMNEIFRETGNRKLKKWLDDNGIDILKLT
jgi:hypothetical protein